MPAQRERPLTVNDLVIVDCDVHAYDQRAFSRQARCSPRAEPGAPTRS